MEKHGKVTPIYAIMNSFQNLSFGKGDHFHVLVFYAGYFIREIKNIFLRLGELEIAWKYLPYGLVFPRQLLVLPNVHLCFYNCVETRKVVSIS